MRDAEYGDIKFFGVARDMRFDEAQCQRLLACMAVSACGDISAGRAIGEKNGFATGRICIVWRCLLYTSDAADD